MLPMKIGAALSRAFEPLLQLSVVGTVLFGIGAAVALLWTLIGWLLFVPAWIFDMNPRWGPLVDRDTSCVGIILAWLVLLPFGIANTWVWLYLAYQMVKATTG